MGWRGDGLPAYRYSLASIYQQLLPNTWSTAWLLTSETWKPAKMVSL
jgi:hypothetical protein